MIYEYAALVSKGAPTKLDRRGRGTSVTTVTHIEIPMGQGASSSLWR